MLGPPVSIGCSVVVSPGVAGAPDSGTITVILPGGPTAGGMPLAMAGSICTMINSLSGVPYTYYRTTLSWRLTVIDPSFDAGCSAPAVNCCERLFTPGSENPYT